MKVFLWIVAALLAVTVAVVVALPYAATLYDWPEMEFDLSTNLSAHASGLVSNKTVRFKMSVVRNSFGGYAVLAKGTALDWPFTATADVRFGFLGIKGNASLQVSGSPWGANANYGASLTGGWKLSLSVPETVFDETDPLLGALAAASVGNSVSNLMFSGTASLSAEACMTNGMKVPRWNASCRVNGLSATASTVAGKAHVAGVSAGVSASGIDDHFDVAPIRIRAASIGGAGFSLTNAFASLRLEESAYVVTEAGGGFCGGKARLYALRMDPKQLTAGFTMLVDDVDAGKLLCKVSGFNGSASGRLHGKFPMYYRNGRIRLGNLYLYSTPGEKGSICMNDPEPLVENLAAGGLPPGTRASLSKALRNLTYEVLKLDLRPDKDGSSSLSIAIHGSSSSGSVEVPVSLQLNFHGDIERLINLGIGIKGGRTK